MKSVASTNPYQSVRYFIGSVVDNKDPQQKQRVKILIPGLIEGEVDSLPWVGLKLHSPFGVGKDFGVVCVPNLGAQVLAVPQDGTIDYFLIDSHVATTEFVPPPELLENYPRRWGAQTPYGHIFYSDEQSGEVCFKHKSGMSWKIDKSGNIEMSTPGSVSETVNQNKITTVNQNKTTTVKGDNNVSISKTDVRTVSGSASYTAASWAFKGAATFSDAVTLSSTLDVAAAATFKSTAAISGMLTFGSFGSNAGGEVTGSNVVMSVGNVKINGKSVAGHNHDIPGGSTDNF